MLAVPYSSRRTAIHMRAGQREPNQNFTTRGTVSA